MNKLRRTWTGYWLWSWKYSANSAQIDYFLGCEACTARVHCRRVDLLISQVHGRIQQSIRYGETVVHHVVNGEHFEHGMYLVMVKLNGLIMHRTCLQFFPFAYHVKLIILDKCFYLSPEYFRGFLVSPRIFSKINLVGVVLEVQWMLRAFADNPHLLVVLDGSRDCNLTAVDDLIHEFAPHVDFLV